MTDCLCVHYDRFTKPTGATLISQIIDLPPHCAITDWMELLETDGAEVLCTYVHPAWGNLPAVTRNHYGKGQAVYLGCCFEKEGLDALLSYLIAEWNIPHPACRFPVIIKSGTNPEGNTITYYLNFSQEEQKVSIHPAGTELLSGTELSKNQGLLLPAWGVCILESNLI